MNFVHLLLCEQTIEGEGGRESILEQVCTQTRQWTGKEVFFFLLAFLSFTRSEKTNNERTNERLSSTVNEDYWDNNDEWYVIILLATAPILVLFFYRWRQEEYYSVFFPLALRYIRRLQFYLARLHTKTTYTQTQREINHQGSLTHLVWTKKRWLLFRINYAC